MMRILLVLKLLKIQAKNPENKSWDSKGKGKCYPRDIRQEDIYYIRQETADSDLAHPGELH